MRCSRRSVKDGDGFPGTVLKVSEGGNIGYVDVND